MHQITRPPVHILQDSMYLSSEIDLVVIELTMELLLSKVPGEGRDGIIQRVLVDV
jgi:hypothetical protein